MDQQFPCFDFLSKGHNVSKEELYNILRSVSNSFCKEESESLLMMNVAMKTIEEGSTKSYSCGEIAETFGVEKGCYRCPYSPNYMNKNEENEKELIKYFINNIEDVSDCNLDDVHFSSIQQYSIYVDENEDGSNNITLGLEAIPIYKCIYTALKRGGREYIPVLEELLAVQYELKTEEIEFAKNICENISKENNVITQIQARKLAEQIITSISNAENVHSIVKKQVQNETKENRSTAHSTPKKKRIPKYSKDQVSFDFDTHNSEARTAEKSSSPVETVIIQNKHIETPKDENADIKNVVHHDEINQSISDNHELMGTIRSNRYCYLTAYDDCLEFYLPSSGERYRVMANEMGQFTKIFNGRGTTFITNDIRLLTHLKLPALCVKAIQSVCAYEEVAKEEANQQTMDEKNGRDIEEAVINHYKRLVKQVLNINQLIEAKELSSFLSLYTYSQYSDENKLYINIDVGTDDIYDSDVEYLLKLSLGGMVISDYINKLNLKLISIEGPKLIVSILEEKGKREIFEMFNLELNKRSKILFEKKIILYVNFNK